MIPQPAKAQAHAAGEHPRESARARVWRHRGGAHMRVEGVGAAVVIGQAEGRTIEVESSSLSHREQAHVIGRPRPRAEKSRGQAYTHHTTTHPMHPGRGSAKDATLGVSCTPASPGPGGSGPASLPPSPPGPAPAAGAIAEAVGARGM